MKKILILYILLFLTSGCVVNDQKISLNDINFSNDLNFEEFKNNLEIYSKNSSYPDLNE